MAEIRDDLRFLPGLVTHEEIIRLRDRLGDVAAGKAQVLQAGDCAEDPADCTPHHVQRRIGLLDTLAGMMMMNCAKPVIRVGRMAGQFAKPRSRPTERCGDIEMPVFLGHMVNSPEPEPELRRPDPRRLLAGYRAASAAIDVLRPGLSGAPTGAPVWTSHEALLLDYELPMIRSGNGGPILASTHWPWIGDRTRQVDGAHVAMLAAVVNPVACKVGPTTSTDDVLALCDRLNPDRVPGMLTFISRMGADQVRAKLGPLVAAVRDARHPVIWLCDPMHGNTVNGPDGRKTRYLSRMIREVTEFSAVVAAQGGVAGGLHLEATPDTVTECVTDNAEPSRSGGGYTSPCDPRLNSEQAIAVVAAWCA